MNKKLLSILLIIAILLSVLAEFYSIYGLSKLFSGAKIAIIVMGVILGIGKILIASVLKLYWDTISLKLKVFLIPTVIILSSLTSIGVYGFLSDAYQQTSIKDKYITTKQDLVSKKKDYYLSIVSDSKKELELIDKSLSDLRKSISTDNQTQRIVNGQIITNIVSTSKKSVESQLNAVNEQKVQLQQKIQSANDSINLYELNIIEIEQNSDVASELGPLKYMAKVFSTDMDYIVNWLIILIVIVLDPLALILLITYFSLINVKEEPSTVENVEPENEIDVEPLIEVEPEQIQEPIEVQPTKRKRGRPKKEKVTEKIDRIIYNEPQLEPTQPNQPVHKKGVAVGGNKKKL